MQPNLLDRAISYIAPGWGRDRVVARAQTRALMSAYDGAVPGHRNASRRYRAGDANSAVLSGALRLRYAARDLERNNPMGARAFSVLTSNVIGAGIVPSVSGVKGRKRDELQAVINGHCDKATIDTAGRQNLYGLEGVAFRAAARDGESYMVRRFARSSEGLPLPFSITVLEADFADTRVHGTLSNGNTAIEGIEFNALGRAVAYHLYNRHPGDVTTHAALTSTRYDAADVVHLYRIDRAGQAKGVSWIAPVLVRLGDSEDVKEAYILRQKIAACFAVFVKRNDPAGEATNVGTTKAGNALEVVEPGMIEYLQPGEDVSFGSPPRVDDLDVFHKVTGRDIAAGLGITYEALTGDLSNVNFSSGRMGWLEMQRNITTWTEQMVRPQMCDKIGAWILEALRLVADVPAKTAIDWTPPRREMIDPGKELEAAAQAARDGLGTRSYFLRSQGFDPEQVDAERAAEIDREKRLGLTYDTSPGAPPKPAVPPKQDNPPPAA